MSVSLISGIKDFVKESEYFIHETKKNVVFKFIALVLVLLSYFGYVVHKYGMENGVYVTFLTWSFFVFCTPIADAGFLLDFPIRLLFKIRMLYSEIIVWIVALGLNLYAFYFNPGVYMKTELLKVFYVILTNPWPLYSIILLSMIGTFMSIYFGDEMIDVARHKERKFYHKHKHIYRGILFVGIMLLTMVLYYFLIHNFGIEVV